MRFTRFVAALLGYAHVPVHGAAALPPFNLALTLNDGVGEVVHPGWPLVLRGDAVLMEDVSAPFPLDPASLKLTITSAQGAAVNWPLQRVTQFSSPPALGPQNDSLRVVWVLDAAQTRNLAPGRYAAEFAWAGRASSPLGFSVAAAPATLSANDEIRRALLESQSAQLRGDAAAAMTALDGVGQRFPESIDVLLQRALVHLERGQPREAMRATQQARAIYHRDHPNDAHPPFAILAVEAKARDAWLKNAVPGPPIPGLPTGPGRTGATTPLPNPSGGALPPPAAPASVAPQPGGALGASSPAPASPSTSLVTLNVNLNLGVGASAGAGAAPATDPAASVIRSLPSTTSAAAPVAAPAPAPAPAVAASGAGAGPAVVSGVVPAAHVTDAKSQADPAGQWAASARAGSQYGSVERSATRATGAPDVPGADDHPNAWCPATRDRGTDWLELTFARPVPATEVRVRQNQGPGAITKVEAIEPGGRSHVWWEGVDPYGQDGSARDAVWFAVRVPRTAYAVEKIKLTLNLGAHTRWKQIDAVQLVEAPGAEIVPVPAQVPVTVPTAAPATTAPATNEPARNAPPPLSSSGSGPNDRIPRGTGVVAAVAYAAPAGWNREDANWATVFRATLGDLNHQGQPDPNSERKHQAAIFVLPPRAAPQGPAALFEPMWRQEFGMFALGDAVVHYRSRLRSGLVVCFMGRFFNRPNQDNRENQTYAVMYLVDLGDRVQPITATLVPGKSMYSMTGMNENEGLRALSGPLGAFLDSLQPAGGAAAPYPAGGLFAPSEIRGNWAVSRSAFGGMYVHAATGASAGAAVAASSNSIDLRDDGSFEYKFSGYFQNPVVGGGGQVSGDSNDGRYALEGDIIRFTPRLPRSYRYDRCAVGVGIVRTPSGTQRILALIGANTSGVFRGPPLIPVGSKYDGVMDWFVEEPRGASRALDPIRSCSRSPIGRGSRPARCTASFSRERRRAAGMPTEKPAAGRAGIHCRSCAPTRASIPRPPGAAWRRVVSPSPIRRRCGNSPAPAA